MGVRMQKEKSVQKGSTEKLLSGVMLLTLAGVLVKILGFFYKVPLNALLGDEMANVNAAYAIYALLYTVSTAGVPNAVSLSVARARARGRDTERILRITVGAFFLLGALLSVLLLIFAYPIAKINSGGDSYLCLLAISPALAFTALGSVLRGYFQGCERMEPTAVSELLEAIGKTLFGVLFALLTLSYFQGSVRLAAALSVFAITVGTAMSAAYLGFRYRKRERQKAVLAVQGEEESGRRVFLGILTLALPITASAALMSLSSLIDALLMRPLLTSYYGNALLAKALYSDYSTGALTLYNLPSILIVPMSAAMIPFVSAALERGQRERAKAVMETALRSAALISLPAALGMSALASPILSFVFRSDADMAENAGPLLSVLAISVFFSAVFTVTCAALQAAKKERLPLLSLLIGISVKLVSLFALTHTVGEIGVPVSTLLFYVAICLSNLFFVRSVLSLRLDLVKTFFKPAAAALLCAVCAYIFYTLLYGRVGESLSLFVAIGIAAVVYFCLSVLFRCVGKQELSYLPFGKKILRFLHLNA